MKKKNTDTGSRRLVPITWRTQLVFTSQCIHQSLAGLDLVQMGWGEEGGDVHTSMCTQEPVTLGTHSLRLLI